MLWCDQSTHDWHRLRAFIFLTLIFFASTASAQVGNAVSLLNSTITTSTTGSNAVASGNKCVGRIVATNNSGTSPTLAARIEHSPTGEAGSFKTLLDFTQITTGSNVTEDVHVSDFNTQIYPVVRAVSTLGGTSPNYTVDIRFYCESRR